MSGIADVRDVVRGAFATLLGFSGRLFARTFAIILAGRMFGIEAVGHLGSIAAICEILSILCVLGLKRSQLDMLSHEVENGRRPEARVLEALGLTAALSLVLASIMLFLWPVLFPALMSAHPLLPYCLFIVIPGYAISDVALSAIKFKRVVQWDVWARAIAEPWALLGLVLLAYMLGNLQAGLLYAYAGSVAVAVLISLFGLLRTYGLGPLARAKPQISKWPSIVKQSVPVGITDIGIVALRRVDLIIVRTIVGAEGAGLYYIVQNLATIPQKVNGLFEPMMSPVMARLHNRFDSVKISANLIGVCRWVFIIQLALTVPMIVFGAPLMGLFGAAFTGGLLVLSLVLIGELINGTFVLVETPLVYAKPKIPPSLLVIALILEIILITALSYIWGVEGAGLGFLLTLLFLTLARLYMLKKHLGISVINTSYVLPAIFAGLLALILLGVRDGLRIESGGLLTVFVIVGWVIFFTLIRWAALTKTDTVLLRLWHRKRQQKRMLKKRARTDD